MILRDIRLHLLLSDACRKLTVCLETANRPKRVCLSVACQDESQVKSSSKSDTSSVVRPAPPVKLPKASSMSITGFQHSMRRLPAYLIVLLAWFACCWSSTRDNWPKFSCRLDVKAL